MTKFDFRSNKKKKIIARISIFASFLTLVVVTFVSVNSFALDPATLRVYSKNNILYYDPNGGCSGSSSGSATKLSGDTIAEKAWNFFVDKGITEPAMIAGILGNFAAETGGGDLDALDPLLKFHSGSWYYGIHQTPSEELKNRVNQALGDDYFHTINESNRATDEQKEKALSIELEYMLEIDGGDMGDNFYYFKHAIDRSLSNHVTYKTGKDGAASYAEMFMALIERCVNGDEQIQDPAVSNYVSAAYGGGSYLYQSRNQRVTAAQEAYERFANGSTTNNSTTTQTNSSSSTVSGLDENGYRHFTEENRADFTYYSQTDPKWSDHPYWRDTMGHAACGPTTMAMLVESMTGVEINPQWLADQVPESAYDKNYAWELLNSGPIDAIKNEKNIDLEISEEITGNKQERIDKINKYLDEGWMIWTGGKGVCNNNNDNDAGTPGSPWNTRACNHVTGIYGKKSNTEWFIADPFNETGERNNNGTTYDCDGESNSKDGIYNPNDILDYMWTDYVHAVRAKYTGQGAVNSCGEGEGISGNGTKPIGSVEDGTIFESSNDIACADGTDDLGLFYGYNGELYRMCRINEIKGQGPGLNNPKCEEHSGSEMGHCTWGNRDSNDGAVVNSRVSGAFLALAKDIIALGKTPQSASSYRSINDSLNAPNSNHAKGLAIDFHCGDYSGGLRNSVAAEVYERHGLYNKVNGEPWHTSVTGY